MMRLPINPVFMPSTNHGPWARCCRPSAILVICLLCLAMGMISPAYARTVDAKQLFFQADACARSLRADARRVNFKHHWMRCIRKYEKALAQDPQGPWAAASLYSMARLYEDLARYSGLAKYRQEALNHYVQVIQKYPSSRYVPKAKNAGRRLDPAAIKRAAKKKKVPKAKSDRKQTAKRVATDSQSGRKKYAAAEKCYRALLESSGRQRYRDAWLRCIDRYQSVYKMDPQGPWAPAGLFWSAKLFSELYKRSYRPADRQEAIAAYEKIQDRFPKSAYRIKADQELAQLDRKDGRPVEKKPPPEAPAEIASQKDSKDAIAAAIQKAEMAVAKKEQTKTADAGGPTVVTGLRHWSNPNYTRVVIDVDGEADYAHRMLGKDPKSRKPHRLYVDVDNARLGPQIQKFNPINDNLLLDTRAGQYALDSVRVVVDIKSYKNYKIFSLREPFRIVIDVWGEASAKSKTAPQKGPRIVVPLPEDGQVSPHSLAKQLALGVRRVVIDAGHGGRDYGASGYLKGVYEKKVTLQIAKRLAGKVRKQLGLEAILTRSGDRYLTLEERTAMANTKNADLFISIHTNAVRDRRAYGIETYFLNLATDDDAILVAARENATSTKNISDLQAILSDLMQNAKINESSRLAGYVQSSLYGHLKKKYRHIRNKGVKQAPFYVLLGAQMPAVLIETSFISNPRECRRLVDRSYQEELCNGIIKGIRTYIRKTNPTAFNRSSVAKIPAG